MSIEDDHLLPLSGQLLPPDPWAGHGGWTRPIRRLAGFVVAVAVLGAWLWIERAPLLRDAADLWIVSDPITAADAAVVLGGGLDVRPFAAARLYRQGLVKRVLVSQLDDNYPAVAIGVELRHTEANRQVLLKLGVPASAIETFGTANKNTRDEATALRAWAELHHPAALIIPMDIFAARRVRWMFDQEFSEQQVRIEVPSFEPPDYSRTNWWHSDIGIVAFQNEVLKYIYYRLKY
jgi:uncharacterized SAM-binding protein YcdF (DUF218 family)